MWSSLRAKLIASHLLVILALVPALGFYLLYAWENFYIENLLQQLNYQAHLIQVQAQREEHVVTDPNAAQAFVDELVQSTGARILLVAQDATLLASSHQEDANLIGTPLDKPEIRDALQAKTIQGTGRGLASQVAYVVLPLEYAGRVRGALRVSYSIEDVHAQITRLRWLVLGGVAVTLLLALALSLGLAATITRPLSELAWAVRRIAAGNYQAHVPAKGRDEVGDLGRSFNRMADELAAADRMQERQLSAIVHEIRRPLAGMRAAVETLQDISDLDPESRTVLWNGIEQELSRLERLLNTLQSAHKRALTPLQIKTAPVALDSVIHAGVALFEPVAHARGITLLTQITEPLPPVMADQDRLIQVLTNLLDNALKFTPPAGTVMVSAWQDNAWIWIRVSDTGTGISPQELPYLFQQFYRGDESRPPEKRGMGLGLALSREIIRAHGGEITAASTAAQGTAFTFRLPTRP